MSRFGPPVALSSRLRADAAPTSRRGTRIPAPILQGVDAILASYSQVLFSRSKVVGLILMVASFVVPSVGLVGLLGVALASSVAVVVGLDREAVRTGVLGYNALLVFLLVGAALEHSPAFWALAVVLAGLVVLVHVAVGTALHWHLRLPPLSLPFVLTSWVALASVPYIRGMAYRERLPALDLGAFPGPEIVDTFFRSLGAIFLQPHWVAGALVFGAILIFSRIAALHALLGFGVAVFADAYIFSFPPDFVHLYVGFNFIVTAVALGGIYYVPGPASMALAAFGSLASGMLSVALVHVLQPFGLPVLSLPLVMTLFVVLYALAQRGPEARPRPVDFVAGSPEENLNFFRTRVARFRSGLPVPVQLPFRGTWICTQGNDGEHTHQGPWRHGLDFEVSDRDGNRHCGEGEELTDWLCYRLPVTAAAAGTVIRVVDGLEDTAIDEVDTENNWGNLVILQHAPGLYSMVAHLSPGSLAVSEGDLVQAGQTLGKVGSSGRSPVPHLHFQLQATPDVGDPTIAVEFQGAVVDSETPTLRSRHLPQRGQRVRNVSRQKALAAALSLPPGQHLQVRVTTEAGVRAEELISDIDPLGNRSLVSPSRDARLWFENRGDTFVVYDHAGPRDGALFALYAALARLPLEDAAELRWDDQLNPRRLGTQPLAWLRDAAAALIPPGEQGIAYVGRRKEDRFVVEGTSPGSAGQRPVRTEAVVRLGHGLVSAWVEVGARRVTVEVVE